MTSVGTVLSFPIPAYSNVPIEPQFYQPSRFIISAITEGPTTTVTTSVDHNYVIGQMVRLLIPAPYGAYQLNGRDGLVISIPASTQVTLLIDSQLCDAFIPSPTFVTGQNLTVPQIMAIGDVNTGALNSVPTNTSTFIPGSFIDISPN